MRAHRARFLRCRKRSGVTQVLHVNKDIAESFEIVIFRKGDDRPVQITQLVQVDHAKPKVLQVANLTLKLREFGVQETFATPRRGWPENA